MQEKAAPPQQTPQRVPSLTCYCGSMVEQFTRNEQVVSSILTSSSTAEPAVYKGLRVFYNEQGGQPMPALQRIGKEKVVAHHLDVPFRVLEERYSHGVRTRNPL